MDGAAVEQIAGLSQKPLELGGFLYRPNDWSVEDPASLVKPGPTAKSLAVSTLDGLDLGKLVVHVASPSSVWVYGPLDARTRTRETYVAASAADLLDGFLGTFMPIETMVVGLQTRFAADPSDDRETSRLGWQHQEPVEHRRDR